MLCLPTHGKARKDAMRRTALVALLLLAACEPSDPDAVTYQGTIRAHVETHCLSCHVAGGIAPFALDDPEVVASIAPLIVTQVESGAMPPYHYVDECRDVEDSLALDADVVADFAAWRDDGFGMGEDADYVAPDRPDVEPLRDADLVLVPDPGYLPDGSIQDDYRCLILDHEFEADTFVVAEDIVPGRRDLVHHVIIFEVPAELRPALEDLDAAEEGPGYTCFGDAGLDDGAVMIGGWAPGPSQVELGDDSAVRVKAGSKLVMQVHYNVVAAVLSGDGEPDRSELHLWTLPAGEEPANLTTLFPVAHGGIAIAAGDAESTHTRDQRIPVDSTIVGVAPHMHLLGKQLTTTVERADGSSDCVTQIDDWDFNWQRAYFFGEEEQVELDLYDQVEITCTYDNSPENQPIVDGEQIDPRDVYWGEGTFDEMCLDFLILRTPYAGGGDGGTCGGFQGCVQACADDDPTCAIECMGSVGYPCVYCGLEAAFYGDCMQSECGLAMLAFGNCYQERPAGVGLFDTMVDHCADEWAAASACMNPLLKDGTCAADFEACPGIAP